jgi:hypothetical protein
MPAPNSGGRPGSANGHLASDSDAADRAARAKVDQIKDRYVTAEAIGEDALVRHFDEVSQRQRDLIRDYLEQPGLKPSAVLKPVDENPAQDEPAHEAESATPAYEAESATHST